MEPRNDGTWLLVGVAAGCGFVMLLMICVVTGMFVYAGRTASAPPVTGYPTPYPPVTLLPPPTFVPPPVPPTALDDRSPRVVRATITSVTGTPGVSVGQTCEFNVERRDSPDGTGFLCNAQIVCAGHLLYGGPTAGFFPCTLFSAPSRGVVGTDHDTTAVDHDAAMSIDSAQSHLEIWDDREGATGEFRVVAHIDSIE